MGRPIRAGQFTQVGKFMGTPTGFQVHKQTTGASAFWADIAQQMATHPDQWMLIYEYDPRTEHGPNKVKDARALALSAARRIEQSSDASLNNSKSHAQISALKELSTDHMGFFAEVYTEDNSTFLVYAKYARRNLQ